MHCRDREPDSRVVCIEGDSAFGFSGMELETIARYNLPIIIIVVNNNGIYNGLGERMYRELTAGETPVSLQIPPTSLLPAVRYERMMGMFGLEGALCRTVPEIEAALAAALADATRPHLINVLINPMATRKAQQFDWLTRAKM